jgi:P-type Ca2+ transporter type 2C
VPLAPAPPAADVAGLTTTEAQQRLRTVGPNRLAEPAARSALACFLDQFRNLLVVVLLCAAVLAGVIGELKDAAVIGVVLVLNAVMGFVQEHRAERSLAALRAMLVATARVRRDGEIVELPVEDVVPDDLVLLEAGDRVPADGRFLVVNGVEIDESSLTGESVPVPKRVGGPVEGVPLAERSGAAFLNTVVTRGRGELLVTATGMATEIGAIADLLAGAAPIPTPLQHQLHVLARRLAAVAGVAVVIFAALELLRAQPLGETLLSAVALAVAAIPEGLPAVVTVTLAVGTAQLARRGAIVKRLASVETLGATTVICSDKTGTLTRNEMTAQALLSAEGRVDLTSDGFVPGRMGAAVLAAAALCNDASVRDGVEIGDPTEVALVRVARAARVDVARLRELRPRVAEAPFDADTKLMATFHAEGSTTLVLVKGAAEVVLGCSRADEDERARWAVAAEALAAEGLRVLAVARRRLPGPVVPGEDLLAHVRGLELLGLVGLLDPARPEAAEAVARCRSAGIAVKMITGDHAATAAAVARAVGIPGAVVTGADLDALDDAALAARIDRIGVVARVAPEHKVRIVRALRAQGHVVAMTGDGVNDAPALKAADIGVAMGLTGTEVTKEAAAMVLTDDDMATIVGAVEQGRTIYANIVKFVRYQLATNVGAIATMLAAPLLGLPAPFTALQILWVNLIMDGPPAMALGLDPSDEETMARAPRGRSARILDGARLRRVVGSGAVMAVGTLGVLAHGLATGPRGEALTLAFTTFVLFQLVNAFNVRDELASAFRRASLRNGKLWGALGGVLGLQVLALHVGSLQGIFGTVALAPGQWLLAATVASSVLWVEEVRKRRARRRVG